ncbi:porin [Dysgonomonas sp. ZJ709]|uniref:porin n=1 Tax=Dysgonomonas sp. ZJ709 TaxID=2709797 RepID=UPI0013E9A6A3|nr:porin [Dysgonomonas sp. ZJ709]
MNTIKRIFFIINCLALTGLTFAQQDTTITDTQKLEKRLDNLEKVVNKLSNVKLSGYFQAQYIYAEKDAVLRIGAPNENPNENFSRIGIRRARIKTTYEEGLGSAVFQLDITERGIIVRDAYLKFKDPFFKTNFVQAGVFFRPFGHEVRYSSSRREMPERSRIVNTLFPNERDLGVMLQFQAKETSPLHFMFLETALIAGNGVVRETDSRRDFIGHISASPKISKDITLSIGASYYLGSVYQGSENVYSMRDNVFVVNSNPNNIGKYAKREYFGAEILASTNSNAPIGRTQLRTEYIFGQQPASLTSSGSPNSPNRPTHDTYLRDFKGGYVILIQDVGKHPFSGVFKYQWYDPNTKISGDNIGLNATTDTEISYNAIGLGAIWKVYKNTQLQAYYEINNNETSKNLPGFEINRPDNTFTFTLQYVY